MSINKHISWDLAEDVLEICKPLFELFQINYFDHARFYPNGNMLLLFSNRDYVNFFINHPIYKSPTNYITPGMHLWNSYIDLAFLGQVKEEFRHDHGLTIAIEKSEYIEIYNFATIANNNKIYDLYLNNQDMLYKFISFFQEKAKKIIAKAERQLIIAPIGNMAPEGKHSLSDAYAAFIKLIADTNISQNSFNKSLSLLSKRESECLSHLAKGYTAKEIARELSISFRTVEGYIDSIRNKFNCRNRLELIGQLVKNT